MTQKQKDYQFLEAYQQYLLNAYEAFWDLLPCDLHEPLNKKQIMQQLVDYAKGALMRADKVDSQTRAEHLRKYAALISNPVICSQHADNLIARRDKSDERRQAIREKIAMLVDEHGEDSSLFLDVIPPDDPLSVREGMKIRKQIEILAKVKAKMKNPKPVDRSAIPKDCELLSVQQVAGLLGWGESVVRQRNKRGKLPAPIRIGGTIQWSKNELLDWIAAGCPARQMWERQMQRKRGVK